MNPEQLIAIAGARSLQRMDVPGTGRPFWTVAECGMACGIIGHRDRRGDVHIERMPPEVFAALLYSYAGADDCFNLLADELLATARALRLTENWPMQVVRLDGQRSDYLADLVALSLWEEAQPWRFGSVQGFSVSPMYVARLNVTEKVWRARLADSYAALRWRYVTWLSMGRQHMRRSMRRSQSQDDDSVAIESFAT